MHNAACESARAVTCAHLLGNFAPVYEWIFDNQASLAPKQVTESTKKLMKSEADYLSCLDSNDTKAAVARDIEEGNRLGIRSTPTLFINGHKVEGALPLEAWILLVEKLTAK